MLKLILQLLIPGMCLGCVYGLNGIGSALLYKGSHTINNAQGAVVGFGALLGYHIQQGFHLGLIWSTIIVVIVCFFLGVFLQVCIISQVEKRSSMYVVIATLALSLIIRSINLLVFGSFTYASANISINGSNYLHIASADIDILWSTIFAIVISFIAMIAIHIFLNKTKFGMGMRAAAMDPTAAESCGVSVIKTRAVTWGIMSALGALSGCLLGPLFGINVTIGIAIGQKGNTGAVLGGYGNMYGAVIGGLIVGIAETIFGFIYSPYQNAFTYALFLVFILLLPRGITNEKALEEG
ncbi:MAG: branched-chain amino acid ABC transporter permease [Firmicutes bacterium]|nr:branched-chain amino acid ABC transporter permease [Bacillota bacterium]